MEPLKLKTKGSTFVGPQQKEGRTMLGKTVDLEVWRHNKHKTLIFAPRSAKISTNTQDKLLDARL